MYHPILCLLLPDIECIDTKYLTFAFYDVNLDGNVGIVGNVDTQVDIDVHIDAGVEFGSDDKV